MAKSSADIYRILAKINDLRRQQSPTAVPWRICTRHKSTGRIHQYFAIFEGEQQISLEVYWKNNLYALLHFQYHMLKEVINLGSLSEA